MCSRNVWSFLVLFPFCDQVLLYHLSFWSRVKVEYKNKWTLRTILRMLGRRSVFLFLFFTRLRTIFLPAEGGGGSRESADNYRAGEVNRRACLVFGYRQPPSGCNLTLDPLND